MLILKILSADSLDMPSTYYQIGTNYILLPEPYRTLKSLGNNKIIGQYLAGDGWKSTSSNPNLSISGFEDYFTSEHVIHNITEILEKEKQFTLLRMLLDPSQKIRDLAADIIDTQILPKYEQNNCKTKKGRSGKSKKQRS